MREKARDRGRLNDILENCQYAIDFTKSISFSEFCNDKMRYFATMKNVEIIGEATYMLTHEFRENHPHTPWEQIIGMRHVLVHGYAQISASKLWETVIKDLPILQQSIQQYLDETDWEQWSNLKSMNHD